LLEFAGDVGASEVVPRDVDGRLRVAEDVGGPPAKTVSGTG